MVTLKLPNGQILVVPNEEAQGYIEKGAVEIRGKEPVPNSKPGEYGNRMMSQKTKITGRIKK